MWFAMRWNSSGQLQGSGVRRKCNKATRQLFADSTCKISASDAELPIWMLEKLLEDVQQGSCSSSRSEEHSFFWSMAGEQTCLVQLPVLPSTEVALAPHASLCTDTLYCIMLLGYRAVLGLPSTQQCDLLHSLQNTCPVALCTWVLARASLPNNTAPACANDWFCRIRKSYARLTGGTGFCRRACRGIQFLCAVGA